jgi:hypothetical protein
MGYLPPRTLGAGLGSWSARRGAVSAGIVNESAFSANDNARGRLNTGAEASVNEGLFEEETMHASRRDTYWD